MHVVRKSGVGKKKSSLLKFSTSTQANARFHVHNDSLGNALSGYSKFYFHFLSWNQKINLNQYSLFWYDWGYMEHIWNLSLHNVHSYFCNMADYPGKVPRYHSSIQRLIDSQKDMCIWIPKKVPGHSNTHSTFDHEIEKSNWNDVHFIFTA